MITMIIISCTIIKIIVVCTTEMNDERERIIIVIFVKSVILDIEIYLLFYFQVTYFKIDVFILINFRSITARPFWLAISYRYYILFICTQRMTYGYFYLLKKNPSLQKNLILIYQTRISIIKLSSLGLI